MDFYVILGIGSDGERGGHQARVPAAVAPVSPGINPGDRTARRCFPESHGGVEVLMDPRRRQEYDTGGAARPQAPQPDVPPSSRSSISLDASAHGAQASTGERSSRRSWVPCRGGRCRAGWSRARGPSRDAGGGAPFEVQFTGDERRVVVTRQVPCGACRGTRAQGDGVEGRCPKAARVAARPAGPAGSHGLCEGLRGAAARAGGARTLCQRAWDTGMRSEARPCWFGCRQGIRDAAAARVPEAGQCRPAWRHDRRFVRDDSGRAPRSLSPRR